MRIANETYINIHRITCNCQWPLNKYYGFQVIRFQRWAVLWQNNSWPEIKEQPETNKLKRISLENTRRHSDLAPEICWKQRNRECRSLGLSCMKFIYNLIFMLFVAFGYYSYISLYMWWDLCLCRKKSAAIGEKKIHRGVDRPDSMTPSEFHLF